MKQPLVLGLLLLVCFSWASNIKAKEVTTLDFIYVNANTGAAAGGHTAIRLGSTVFHYQFFPQGQFLLVRESWSHFRYVYNELRNRSVFIARTSIEPAVYDKLRSHFTHLLMMQQHDLNLLHDVELQRDLLIQLAAGAKKLEMEVVGLFDREVKQDKHIGQLHQMVQHQLGDDYLSQMRQQVEANLSGMIVEVETQHSKTAWAERLQTVLLEREFLYLMEVGATLAEDSVLRLLVDAPVLTVEQRQVLKNYQEKLAASVVGLLQSQRPDRARSLMLQTARYIVVSRSLESGVLLTLDPFSSRANVVAVKQKNELPGLYKQLQQDALQAQRNFFNEVAHSDIAYAMLESSMGRLHEIAGALHHGYPARVEPGILLPARKGKVSVASLSFFHPKLPAIIEANEAEWLRLKQRVEQQYTYDLISQNCVTELLRALNSAFEDKLAGQKVLGGWLAPDDDLVFIPNQFYKQIAVHFHIQEYMHYPSRRLRQLDQLDENEDTLRIALRESNTLSSTLYTPRVKDTPFLFFTDDTLLLRPIQGIANLIWGAAYSVGGMFTVPVDGGERIHQGLRGMFYSLPELAFGNIRKGTYGFTETTTVGP